MLPVDDHQHLKAFPVASSLVSSEDLKHEIGTAYAIATPETCVLWRLSRNDTYLVKTAKEQYIARLYGTKWRTFDAISFELELLQHLERNNIAVASPIPRRDGRLTTALDLPEGRRYLVLFHYATGELPFNARAQNLPDAEVDAQSYHIGKALAELHTASDHFTCTHQRPPLDIAFLIDQPMALLQPLLTYRPGDWNFLVAYAERIRENILQLSQQGLEWGIIHGDPFSGNLHIGKDHQVTFYDFDHCGYGWRVWDICDAFVLFKTRGRDEIWHEFLRGYSEQKKVKDITLTAVPYFIAAASIWTMGSRAIKGERVGMEGMNDEYFDQNLEWVHETEQYIANGK